MSNEVRIRASVKDDASKPIHDIHQAWKAFQADGSKGIAIGASAAVTAKGLDLIGGSVYKAGAAIGDFVHDSITAASDLNETINKTDVVFGTSAQKIVDWSKTSATAMGLSQQAALESAASFGNLFKSLDVAPAKVAPMSESLVQLAADLASFNNIPVEEALQKLQSGIVGEARPLRELGVAISEASVKTEAMRLGFHAVNGEFTEGEKVQARYSLILKQTSTAHGDFARTADGLANAQRITNAELKDAQAAIGEKLLPLQLALTKAELAAIPVIEAVAAGLGDLADAAAAAAKDGGDLLSHLPGAAEWAQLNANADKGKEALQQFHDAALEFGKRQNEITDPLKVWVEASTNTATRYSENAAIINKSSGQVALEAKLAADGVEAAHRRIRNASNITTRDLLGDATKLVDDYYNVLTTSDDLAATNAEIDALRRKVAAGNATKDEIAQLHKAEQTQEQLLTDLAEHGKTQDKNYEKAIKSLLKRLETAHGDEKAAIEAEILKLKLLALAAEIANKKVLTLSESISSTIAKGGYVNAAGAGQKPPLAKAPSSSPSFITDRSAAPLLMGSQPIVITVNPVLQGIATPAMLAQIERDLGPVIAKVVRQTAR